MDGVDEPCSPTPPTGQHQHQKRTFDALQKPDIFTCSRQRHVTRLLPAHSSFCSSRMAQTKRVIAPPTMLPNRGCLPPSSEPEAVITPPPGGRDAPGMRNTISTSSRLISIRRT